ncbi:MAG TPA: MmcQ/YjbR family DNA-binding protein [Chthoniobacterales bacterium]|nr:MmcQ/YjbR family DNA-binding protein [Chthoniobacterales bacterium]
MTPADFRKIALSMPEAIESEHMAHPDFRVGGKIFASLGYPDQEHGMVVLPPEEQAKLLRSHPKTFFPAKGAWGKKGSTCVRLETVDKATLQRALEVAWRNRAPTKLKVVRK